MFKLFSHRRRAIAGRTLLNVFLIAAIVAPALIAGDARAASVTLTSTVDSSGYNGGTLAEMPLTADGSFVPANTPWTYDAAQVDALDAIEQISVSLILGSADSAQPGDTNFGEFTLALDGIDTGMTLNGEWEVITSPGEDDVRPPLTFTGTPENAQAILAALKEDNELVGTILDSEPGDDFITLGSSQASFGTTTLVINGVATGEPGGGGGGNGGGGNVIPLPAGVWAGMALLGCLGTGAGAKRMRKR